MSSPASSPTAPLPTPSCLGRLMIESPPDVRMVARRLRQIELLCDVTLVFNEDDVEGAALDEEDAEEKAAPLHAHKLILASSSSYFYEVFGKVSSTGTLKLWLPPPISRQAMSVILDWMYGHDVHQNLLVEDVGYLREVKESAEVLQLSTFVQSIQTILDALVGSHEAERSPFDVGDTTTTTTTSAASITDADVSIKTEVIDDEPVSITAPPSRGSTAGGAATASFSSTPAGAASGLRKRKLDPCLQQQQQQQQYNLGSADAASEADVGSMIRHPGGQYQCKDCLKYFSRISSFKFHRNIAHGDDKREADTPSSKRTRNDSATAPAQDRGDDVESIGVNGRSTTTRDAVICRSESGAPLLANKRGRRTGAKMSLDELRRTLCPSNVSIAAGDFRCHICPMVIRGGKYSCLAVAKHMHRSHAIICQPYALPCPSCNYVSWCSNLTNHQKSGACKYYPKSKKRIPRNNVVFRGKTMPLSTLRADFGFLTMKRNGEWVCPVKTCTYRLFKGDYSNSTFVTRHAAMHMLEEHNHLLEFYACYCYLCPNITFAQATMNQHMNQAHAAHAVQSANSFSLRDGGDDVDGNELDDAAATGEHRTAPTTIAAATTTTTTTMTTVTEDGATTTTTTTSSIPASETSTAATSSSASTFTLTMPTIPSNRVTRLAPRKAAVPPSNVPSSLAIASATSPVLPATTASSKAALCAPLVNGIGKSDAGISNSVSFSLSSSSSSSSLSSSTLSSSSLLLPVKRGRGRPRSQPRGRGLGAPDRFKTGISIDRYTPPVAAAVAAAAEAVTEAAAETMAETMAEASNDESDLTAMDNSLPSVDDAPIETPDTRPSPASSTSTTHSGSRKSGHSGASVPTTSSSVASSSNDVLSAAVASTIETRDVVSSVASTSAVASTASSSSPISDNITAAANKITASLSLQTGDNLTNSQEVTDAIRSVLESLADGGLLSDQNSESEDKVLQIEMDLPGYPGLVIQVPTSILMPASKSKPIKSAHEPQREVPQQRQKPQRSTMSSGVKTTSAPSPVAQPEVQSLTTISDLATVEPLPSATLTLTRVEPIAMPETTLTPLTTDGAVTSDLAFLTSSTALTTQALHHTSAGIGASTKTTASPRRQTTMSGSLVGDSDQGLTLMTSSGLIRLPPGTQQVQSTNGGLHIQLPPGMSLADIGL